MKYIAVLFVIALTLTGCKKENNGELTVNGILEYKSVLVTSKVAGEILTLAKDEGSSVAKGDTLIVIDQANTDIQITQAEANLLSAQAQYELLKNGARKEDIAAAAEMLKQAKVNARLAKSDYERIAALKQSGSATDKQVDDAQSRMELTASQAEQAEYNLNKLKQFARPEELKNAQARVAQAEAQLALLKKNKKDCTVISPVSGIVLKRYFKQGENVTPQSSLLKIGESRDIEVTVYLTALELPKVKTGGDAKVVIDGIPGKDFPGKITFISPDAEFTPKNIQTKDERTKLVFAVKVTIPNETGELKGGLPAEVSFR